MYTSVHRVYIRFEKRSCRAVGTFTRLTTELLYASYTNRTSSYMHRTAHSVKYKRKIGSLDQTFSSALLAVKKKNHFTFYTSPISTDLPDVAWCRVCTRV